MSLNMLSKIFLTVWLGLGLNFMKNMQVVYIKILIRFNLKLLINKIVNQKSFYNLYNKRCALQWKNLPTDTNIALNIFYRVLSESFTHLSELLFTGSRKLQLLNHKSDYELVSRPQTLTDDPQTSVKEGETPGSRNIPPDGPGHHRLELIRPVQLLILILI